jgi:hypothetical protein
VEAPPDLPECIQLTAAEGQRQGCGVYRDEISIVVYTGISETGEVAEGT